MYSIHNTVKEEVKNQVVVEKSLEMMCMFDDLPYIDNMLKYDLQNGDYMVEIEDDWSKKQLLSSWEEEA
jgi:GTPase SAR1 family protein